MTRIPFIYNKCENFSGADLNLIFKIVKEDSEGANFSGLINLIRKNSKGINVSAGVNYLGKDSKGANISGLTNIIEGYSRGANVSGLFNYTGKADDLLIQYATLKNTIAEVPENAFVLQVGLYNKIGGKFFPIIQLYGIKNLPKKIKNIFSKF